MRDKPYAEALGALQYLARCTCPNISFAISILVKFQKNPGPTHWTALKRVYQYIRGTSDWCLTFGNPDDTDLYGYADADGMSQTNRKAISGYVFKVYGGAVSWQSKQQDIIALSTTEAELVASVNASKEAIWLRNMTTQLFDPITTSTTLLVDNMGAQKVAANDANQRMTKHMDIRFHWIRFEIEKKTIRLQYVPTEDNVADIFTKALPSAKAKHFASLMGLRKA